VALTRHSPCSHDRSPCNPNSKRKAVLAEPGQVASPLKAATVKIINSGVHVAEITKGGCMRRIDIDRGITKKFLEKRRLEVQYSTVHEGSDIIKDLDTILQQFQRLR